MLVLTYLAAVVAANLSVAHFGPSAAVFNAFALIGLDLVARDRLHDRWRGRALWPKMLALIATGGLISWLVAPGAARVAEASTAAFVAAALVDALAYHSLRRLPWFERANGSNLSSAAVDSLVFPTLAFGGLSWAVTLAQFSAKVAGGLVWTLVLRRRRRLEPVEAAPAAA